MIITRAPLRISFGGGGSDLPAYYKQNVGTVLSTTIDKYVTIVLNRNYYKENIILKYSQIENVNHRNHIKHPIIKEIFKHYGIKSGLEIYSYSDIPSGTGMGSSSTFTVSLAKAFCMLKKKRYNKSDIAKIACEIEINKLREPIGKQDQYAAAYGGFNLIKFNQNGTVNVEKLNLEQNELKLLKQNIMLFSTGGTRRASSVLKEQQKLIQNNTLTKNRINCLVEIAKNMKYQLINKNYDAFGSLIDEGWQIKRKLSKNISGERIDDIYNRAKTAGALGGKLLGAGKNGFFLIYANKKFQNKIREELKDLTELQFNWENKGVHVILSS